MSSLSVTLANYNHAQYVAQAIEAIVTQSRPPDEFIIIDDASTDNSFEIISSYASRYPYIRLERNERNLGAVATGRHLANMAKGDYVYWLPLMTMCCRGSLKQRWRWQSSIPKLVLYLVNT